MTNAIFAEIVEAVKFPAATDFHREGDADDVLHPKLNELFAKCHAAELNEDDVYALTAAHLIALGWRVTYIGPGSLLIVET